QNAYGIEWNLNYDFFKWLQYTISLNFYQAITEGTYEDRDYYSNSNSMEGQTSAKLKFPKILDIQVSLDYRAPRTTTQGKRNAIYSVDMGSSRDILNGKGTLTLSGRDLFNQRKYSGYAEGPEFYTEEVFVWRNRQIILNFSYRINQQKAPEKPENGNDGQGDDFGF